MSSWSVEVWPASVLQRGCRTTWVAALNAFACQNAMALKEAVQLHIRVLFKTTSPGSEVLKRERPNRGHLEAANLKLSSALGLDRVKAGAPKNWKWLFSQIIHWMSMLCVSS